MNFTIKPMDESSIDGVEALENECFASPWSRADIEHQLSNGNAYFLTASADDEIAGYIGIYELFESCEVANLAVSAKFRRNGIARALLRRAEEGARERNREFITLEVRMSNTPAINLYSSEGFEKIGVRKNFYSSPTEDGIIMTKYFKENR